MAYLDARVSRAAEIPALAYCFARTGARSGAGRGAGAPADGDQRLSNLETRVPCRQIGTAAECGFSGQRGYCDFGAAGAIFYWGIHHLDDPAGRLDPRQDGGALEAGDHGSARIPNLAHLGPARQEGGSGGRSRRAGGANGGGLSGRDRSGRWGSARRRGGDRAEHDHGGIAAGGAAAGRQGYTPRQLCARAPSGLRRRAWALAQRRPASCG